METTGPGVLSELDKGVVVGVLLSAGHFGGDGRQPHVVVKMHTRHERLLRFLHERVPGSRLYGPYSYGKRDFFQWVARGKVLARYLIPLLDEIGMESYDGHSAARYATMKERYADAIRRAGA